MNGETIFSISCALCIPAVMVLAAALFWGGGPAHINGLSGYRTRLSMRNIDTWRFAHRYLARWWLPLGAAMLAGSAAVLDWAGRACSEGEQGTVILLLVSAQTVVLVLPLWPSERALAKNFDRFGCPCTPLGLRLSAARGGANAESGAAAMQPAGEPSAAPDKAASPAAQSGGDAAAQPVSAARLRAAHALPSTDAESETDELSDYGPAE